MLTLYCDASGKKADQPALVVAGYMSTVEGWANFDLQWQIALARNDVTYFHMKDFAHFKGEYKLWRGDEDRRIAFLKQLATIIRDNVLFGVASAIRYEVFDKVNSLYHLDKHFRSPYALCGRDCIAQANKKALALGFGGSRLQCIFEDGDEGKGDLMEVLQREKQLRPIFKPSRPRTISTHPGVVQLQAADFAAYELLKAVKEMEKNSPLWNFRKSLKVLADIRNWWGTYKERDLIEICEEAGVAKRRAQV